MAADRLLKLSKFYKRLDKFPTSTFGGDDVLKEASAKIKKQAHRVTVARGKGVRFVMIRGKIVPMRPKKKRK